MQDLNDFAWFVQVVDHGGFAAAGRALDQPKSKLSRRIAQLEERLGVRLIQRTTRQFAVTGPTWHWVREGMLAGDEVLANVEKDTAPTLLLQAEEERVVDNL
ncbi:LysR family transcriptional regulator, partial [Klebsiella pneumoniae]|uniref:LysR family transcriptional regulator n=1 Tax=Klebsiella pneumoniae TaxID=573 RepID=UPI001F51C500